MFFIVNSYDIDHSSKDIEKGVQPKNHPQAPSA
jgi:hypothetical protein